MKKMKETNIVRTAHTYWKKKYNITNEQLELMRILRDHNYPIMVKRDLEIQSNKSEYIIKQLLKNLIKTRLVNLERKKNLSCLYLSTNGKKFLEKWD